ncbi:MAG: ATPase, partial [Gammaproteobacteria bacterium]
SRHSTGIVRSNPPWDALTTSKRVKYLKSVWRELRQIEKNGTEAEYDEKAAKFYGLLRAAWERLVEEKLLNKVVQRFSREVPTQRLKRLIDIEQPDIDRVDAAMTKCSALIDGHDDAAGVYQNMPNLDCVMDDIKDIEEYLAELQGRNRN